MKRTKMLSTLVLMLFISICTQAQTTATRATQPARVKQGVRSGELTRHETRKLVKQQKNIRQDVREAKSDGVVTTDEKKEIKQEKRQAKRNIYRKKHNGRDRD